MALVPAKNNNTDNRRYPKKNRSMFVDGFAERRDLEQYFWTQKTVRQMMNALQMVPEGQVCCLAAPSLSHGFYTEQQRAELLLDIDTRFDYLPRYRYFDILKPIEMEPNDSFWVVVFDPPFFYIPMDALYKAVLKVTRGDTKVKLMIGFLIREEQLLLSTFKAFNLKRTKFRMEYAAVKPNKWTNYALYSNVQLPGIRTID